MDELYQTLSQRLFPGKKEKHSIISSCKEAAFQRSFIIHAIHRFLLFTLMNLYWKIQRENTLEIDDG